MLFNFELTNTRDVAPWGAQGNLSLSWFGLTDGKYWIDVETATLFEYSEHARQVGAYRYCDYQVIRLLEDILDMLPTALEPIPRQFVRYIAGESGQVWRKKVAEWSEKNCELLNDDDFWRVKEPADKLLYGRFLDTAYLSPSTRILLWSDDESVHIEWDNSDKLIEGQFAWTALTGSYLISRENFLAEVESFHHRLIEQMCKRIAEVEAGAISSGIDINLPGLRTEHEQRRIMYERALEITSETPWVEVQQAIEVIEASAK